MTRDTELPRRAYLRTAGATAALAALAGCGDDTSEPTTTPPTTTTTPPTRTTSRTGTTTDTTETGTTVNEDRFGTVVNVVEAGADQTGESPVNPVLEEHVGDDTLLYFPPGRYRLADWELIGYRNLGIVGDDAALVPPEDERDYWLLWGELENLLFAGFTLDCRAPGVAPVAHVSVSGGSSVVRDVTVRGHRRAPRSGFEVAATDPNAELRFENVALPDGSTSGNAIFVFPESVGPLSFRNCRIEHWAEGLYAAYQSGSLAVVGGYYANNGIDQVRVGGARDGAVVRGVTVRIDGPKQPEQKPNMRGIWLEEGAKARIENCDVAVTDLAGTYSSGAIVVGRQFGRATIRNTRIRTDAETYAVHVRDPIDSLDGEWVPSMDRLPDEWRVSCRDVRIEGSATDLAAFRTTRRDDCRFERVCVDHPEGSRHGVSVAGAEGCAVRDATLDVSGEPIHSENATVETARVRTDGSC